MEGVRSRCSSQPASQGLPSMICTPGPPKSSHLPKESLAHCMLMPRSTTTLAPAGPHSFYLSHQGDPSKVDPRTTGAMPIPGPANLPRQPWKNTLQDPTAHSTPTPANPPWWPKQVYPRTPQVMSSPAVLPRWPDITYSDIPRPMPAPALAVRQAHTVCTGNTPT